jgi:hypothetical protein
MVLVVGLGVGVGVVLVVGLGVGVGLVMVMVLVVGLGVGVGVGVGVGLGLGVLRVFLVLFVRDVELASRVCVWFVATLARQSVEVLATGSATVIVPSSTALDRHVSQLPLLRY